MERRLGETIDGTVPTHRPRGKVSYICPHIPGARKKDHPCALRTAQSGPLIGVGKEEFLVISNT